MITRTTVSDADNAPIAEDELLQELKPGAESDYVSAVVEHHEQIRERVRSVVGEALIVEVATRLRMNPETTRRMLGKSPPSFSFIVAVCREYGVSADWLLFGHRTPEHTLHAHAHFCAAPVAEIAEILSRRLHSEFSVTPR